MADFWRAAQLTCSRERHSDGLSTVRALSLALQPGTITVLAGSGGCGKNLLLRLMGLLEMPDAGEVFLHGLATRALPEDARLSLRNRHFGFVFAEPFLLNTFSVLENVAMPLFKISGLGLEAARQPILEMLDFVGLAHAAATPVQELTLPEQQKISLARALVHRPEILLVENAGDQLTGGDLAAFLALLVEAQQTFATTILVTATNRHLLPGAHRRLEMADGEIVADSHASTTLI